MPGHGSQWVEDRDLSVTYALEWKHSAVEWLAR